MTKPLSSGRNHAERRPNRLFTADEFEWLVAKVCPYYHVTREELFARFKGNVTGNMAYAARQVVLHIAWSSYDAGYDEVAMHFNTPKTTAFKAVKQVEEWRSDHPKLDAFCTSIENEIIARRIATNG